MVMVLLDFWTLGGNNGNCDFGPNKEEHGTGKTKGALARQGQSRFSFVPAQTSASYFCQCSRRIWRDFSMQPFLAYADVSRMYVPEFAGYSLREGSYFPLDQQMISLAPPLPNFSLAESSFRTPPTMISLAPPTPNFSLAESSFQKRRAPYKARKTARSQMKPYDCSAFSTKALVDALQESEADIPRPPPPPAYINMATSWTSKESPSAVMTLVETSFQSTDSRVNWTAKREGFFFQGHLTDSAGRSILCEFMCRLYWLEPDKLTLVEFRRRSGCGITFNRFVTSVKEICYCTVDFWCWMHHNSFSNQTLRARWETGWKTKIMIS
eukprot:g31358.t1